MSTAEPLPPARPDTPLARRSTAELLRRRVSGQFEIDEFGQDVELIELLDPLFALGWRVEVRHAERVPTEGPAVIVNNRRFGISEPVALGRGVRRATGRRVRFLGLPDWSPAGSIVRRMGGAINRPEELASLLKLGHVVSVPLERRPVGRGHAGGLAPFALEPAVAQGAPVIPAAVVGSAISRRWVVILGEPLPRLAQRSPLAKAELVDEARYGVQDLLDEAQPPHWFFG
jgi:hypothetical protein